jgi:guanyl-specific ribonuclease Sa
VPCLPRTLKGERKNKGKSLPAAQPAGGLFAPPVWYVLSITEKCVGILKKTKRFVKRLRRKMNAALADARAGPYNKTGRPAAESKTKEKNPMKQGLRRLAAALLLFALLALCACGDLNETLDTAQQVMDAAQAVSELLSTDEMPQGMDQPPQETANAPPQSAAAQTQTPQQTPCAPDETAQDAPDPDGVYTSCEDVALYLHIYGCLPGNFITKSQARSLGWRGGSLEPYAPGKCIGGDRFGNYEGLLPEGSYTECDIDTLGADSRGAKRLVFSDDGRIYYTEDHYASFIELYGQEDEG